MKKRIQKKFETHDLWAVKGILTTALIFFPLKIMYKKKDLIC
jgi:hypothetical protein